MADTIKSALFVDYDSFHRSQVDESGDVAERLAQTSVAWVAAIESGKLILPPAENGTRRRVLIRRCYADPALLGLHRSALIASGFEVIDCPQQPGRKRNAADLHMAIDTLDALDHPAGYDEFMLLSADADFTPVLLRLRAHNRTTVIYGDEAVSGAYKAIADGIVDAGRFAAVLAGESLDAKPEPAAAEGEASESADVVALGTPPERADIEALARKIHSATNVPMFSPRTFADLFRVLAQEIGENGYHFQNTAESVTEKLTAAGRNVNRRQVLFVVKGLALKGHVFSTTDTPERLAEVFREQVLYLAGNSGVELDEREKAMLPAWILGRAATPLRPVPTATPPKPQPAAEDPAKKVPPPARRRLPARPGATEKESPVLVARAEPAPPVKYEPAPAPEPRIAAPAPSVPKPAAASIAPPVVVPSSAARPEARNTVASRFAAITKGSFGAKSGDAAPRPKPAPPRPEAPPALARPTGAKPSGVGKTAGSGAAAPRQGGKSGQAKPAPEGDALESSILAAIAQAVDVLVEDGGDKPKSKAEAAPVVEIEEVEVEVEIVEADSGEAAELPPDPEPSPGGDSEDIGDEIQRIIASYSRARQQTD